MYIGEIGYKVQIILGQMDDQLRSREVTLIDH
ncbi:Uncharacterised protein [Providencia heimbachae]|nr:Uncharacterised protein [Providencia heimbachae]